MADSKETMSMEELDGVAGGTYRQRAVKAPCFSYGDETAQKYLQKINCACIIEKKFAER